MPDSGETRVLVADSRRLVRELLTSALARVPGVVPTAGSSDLEDVIAQASAGAADVVLLGGDAYPRGLGDAVRRVRSARPQSAVLVVADSDEDESIIEAVQAGAAGAVALKGSLGQLAQRVKSAHAEEMVLPPSIAAKVLAGLRRRPARLGREGSARALTSREREVLALLTDGLGNAEIASRTGVSANTVKNHLYSIYRKLGVNSRAQAFAEAARLGLVRR